jgi:hypothetical protein
VAAVNKGASPVFSRQRAKRVLSKNEKKYSINGCPVFGYAGDGFLLQKPDAGGGQYAERDLSKQLQPDAYQWRGFNL